MALAKEIRPQPTAATAGFGRVFYGASDRLYFSQVFLDDLTVLGKCFQKSDPTAEVANDIVDTDGGEIQLQDSGEIIALSTFHKGVLAFCSKGVWYISGGEAGFSATAYTVDKVSSYRIIGTKAFCNVGSDVLFGSKDSLFLVQNNEFNVPKVVSLTDETIQEYWQGFVAYDTQMVFNEEEKKVYMLRCSCPEGRALVYDLRINGFYPWKLGGKVHEAVLYSPVDGLFFLGKDESEDFITFDELTLTTSDGFVLRGVNESILTFARLSDSAVYRDYGTTQFESFLVTNYETLGNYSRHKGVPLVNVFFRKTETQVDTTSGSLVFDRPSACEMSVLWDFDNEQGSVSPPRQIYDPVPRGYAPAVDGVSSFDTGKTIITFKDKVRGRGRAVQFKFKAVEDKSLELLGFSVQFTAKGRM